MVVKSVVISNVHFKKEKLKKARLKSHAIFSKSKSKSKSKRWSCGFKKNFKFRVNIALRKLVRSERKLTHVILIHILEVESRRLYANLGFDGMFSYLTKALGYSESAAYRRLKSARLLKALPAVADKLEAGSLNLSQLTQVQNCLKIDSEKFKANDQATNAKALELILNKIEHKNSFETKKILAFEFDQPIQTQTVVSPQKDETVRIELTFTKKQFKALEEAKNLLSHTIHNNSLAEVIEHLALKFNKSILGKDKDKDKDKDKVGTNGKGEISDQYCDRKISNPEPHGFQNFSENEKPLKLTRCFSATKPKRSYLSIKLKRDLMNSAAHSCQFVNKSTGQKFESKYQLQVDHLHPLSKGGSNNLENLQILCRAHNHFKAARVDVD